MLAHQVKRSRSARGWIEGDCDNITRAGRPILAGTDEWSPVPSASTHPFARRLPAGRAPSLSRRRRTAWPHAHPLGRRDRHRGPGRAQRRAARRGDPASATCLVRARRDALEGAHRRQDPHRHPGIARRRTLPDITRFPTSTTAAARGHHPLSRQNPLAGRGRRRHAHRRPTPGSTWTVRDSVSAPRRAARCPRPASFPTDGRLG